MSHLLQMRGLKPCKTLDIKSIIVASFTDAWIETFDFKKDEGEGMSHLLQMRGLKHFCLNRKHHRHSRIFYRCVD